jgi:hypothetical protein
MAAVPSSLAPEPGKKLDFMALVDKEDPDDIYELIDELAVGESVLSRLLDVSDAFEKTIATKNPIFCSSSSFFPSCLLVGLVVWWWCGGGRCIVRAHRQAPTAACTKRVTCRLGRLWR